MIPPTFKTGQVEQATYTWSKRNLDGREGFGFGAVSPGLLDSLPWREYRRGKEVRKK